MAKQITPTPTLYDEDANEFVKKMFEKPSAEKIAYIDEILEMFKDYDFEDDF